MSSTRAVQLLKDELADLNRERKKLEAAIEALTGRTVKRVKKAASPAKKTRKKRTGPTQSQKFLDAVATVPGQTVAQVSKRINVPASNLYAIANQLVKAKKVTKKGTGYFPKAQPAAKKPAAKK